MGNRFPIVDLRQQLAMGSKGENAVLCLVCEEDEVPRNGTELSTPAFSGRDVRCHDLKPVMIFHRDERGQLHGQPATFRRPL